MNKMTDRELLELAAKAAGVRHIKYTNDYDGSSGLVLCNEHGAHGAMWSPLTDDGDALRLAVKLGLMVNMRGCLTIFPHVTASNSWIQCEEEEACGDPYAATRRAIVRASAEIGKSK